MKRSHVLASILAGTMLTPVTSLAAQAVPSEPTASTAAPSAQAAPSVAAGVPAPAPASAAAEPAGNADEIVVTGSRVAVTGFEAPTPTQVVSAQNIAQRGLTSIGDFLAELPAFRGSSTSQTNTQASAGFGANYADLRGLGSIRTLTLVDGRRHVPTSPTGQVDLNLIPTALIDRVDVVTGGASAAWGSDAISGVVNIILNKRLKGFRGDVSYGITQYGDNKEKRASLAFGTEFAEGRGRLVLGGDYVSATGITSYQERDWGRKQPTLVTYAAGRAADQPSRFWARGVNQNNQTYGGLILGVNADTNPANGVDVLRGIQFGPGGTILPFTYGTAVGATAINFTGGTNGLNGFSNIYAVLPLTRHAVLAHAEYDLTDGITAFVEGSEGRSGASFTSPSFHDTNLTVRRDNAFLPAAIATIMDANAINTFTLGRYSTDISVPRNDNTSQTTRIVGGLEGKIGSDWSWDVSYEWGQNRYSNNTNNQRIEQRFQYAIDSIIDPVTRTAVCRDVTARAQGCQPLNLFGEGSPSQAARSYVTGLDSYQIKTTQEVADLNIKGQPFSTWAGPVAVAFGGEYRRETAAGLSDAIANSAGYNYNNNRSFNGRYNVKDVYFEAAVPLARDVPFLKSLDINAAVRYSDYSSSGGVTTWKLGGTYAPISDIRFRVVRSRDVRAPNNSELYASTSSVALLRSPFTGITAATAYINAPNPGLRPEKADTFTAGAVITPSFIRRLSISADFYNIKVNDAISSIDPAVILDRCGAELAAGGAGALCAFVNRTGTGAATVISSVTVQLFNLASIRSRGIDLTASYQLPVGPGTLSLQAAANHAIKLETNDGLGNAPVYSAAGYLTSRGSIINRAGQVGGFTSGFNNGATTSPKWTVSTAVTYRIDRFSGTVEGRYVGGGRLDNTLIGPDEAAYSPLSPISIGDNTVDSRFYVNLSAQYDLMANGPRKLSIYGVVSNLTNVDPPFPALGLSGLFDRLGRNFKLGARVAF